MTKKLIVLSVLFTLFLSCKLTIGSYSEGRFTSSKTKEKKEDGNQELKTINLGYDFIVSIGREEIFEKFKTYTYFQLTRNNKTIFVDSSLTEYEFGNGLFPIILKTNEGSYELLFEINNRRNKNYLKRLIIKNDELVKEDKLPTFVAKPIDLNHDGLKEYAGFWDYSQVWGNNNNLTAYNPILYYSVTEQGLQLDTLLTKERNEHIYGKFLGFEFSENNEQPERVIEKFNQEIKRINKGK